MLLSSNGALSTATCRLSTRATADETPAQPKGVATRSSDPSGGRRNRPYCSLHISPQNSQKTNIFGMKTEKIIHQKTQEISIRSMSYGYSMCNYLTSIIRKYSASYLATTSSNLNIDKIRARAAEATRSRSNISSFAISTTADAKS